MAQQSPVMSHGPNKGLKGCKLIGHAVLLSPRLGAKLAQKLRLRVVRLLLRSVPGAPLTGAKL
jgi:hypothetical protein